jgi:ubiquinone/menaquinone biosynthesis C-methylase UbiE
MESRHDNGFFDRWAPTYDRSVLQRLYFAPIQEGALDAFGAGGAAPRDVLDVGCGTGRLLESVARRWTGARLTGVDASEAMVAAARRKHGEDARFSFVRGDAAALPLEPASVDAAFSTLSFHHWQDQPSGIREIARVLRPGGIFVLADVEIPLLSLLRPLMNRVDHAVFLAPAEILRLLDSAGFTMVAHRHSWRLFTGFFVARKRAVPGAGS